MTSCGGLACSHALALSTSLQIHAEYLPLLLLLLLLMLIFSVALMREIFALSRASSMTKALLRAAPLSFVKSD